VLPQELRRWLDMWQNIIVFLVIGAIIAGAIAKIVIDRKNGVKCSGCPYSKECSTAGMCSSQTDLETDK
jgi:TRAP-type C4-dicarboxylate transport system permease small subunit